METEMVTMNTLKDKITDRIKDSFIDLVPEEAWRGMVEKEIANFIEPNKDHYNKTIPSPLQSLIHDELTRRFEVAIRAELDSHPLCGIDGEASEFIKEVIKKVSPALVEGLFSEIVQRAVITVQNSLIRGC